MTTHPHRLDPVRPNKVGKPAPDASRVFNWACFGENGHVEVGVMVVVEQVKFAMATRSSYTRNMIGTQFRYPVQIQVTWHIIDV